MQNMLSQILSHIAYPPKTDIQFPIEAPRSMRWKLIISEMMFQIPDAGRNENETFH